MELKGGRTGRQEVAKKKEEQKSINKLNPFRLNPSFNIKGAAVEEEERKKTTNGLAGLLSQRSAALLVSDLEQTSHGCEFEWQTGTNWCGCFTFPLFSFSFSFSLSLSCNKTKNRMINNSHIYKKSEGRWS